MDANPFRRMIIRKEVDNFLMRFPHLKTTTKQYTSTEHPEQFKELTGVNQKGLEEYWSGAKTPDLKQSVSDDSRRKP